jgi:hypothetical protein
VTHVEDEVDGLNRCLKAVSNLHNRADAMAIRADRDKKATGKANEEAAEEQEKAEKPQEVQRQEPANRTLAAVKELVES